MDEKTLRFRWRKRPDIEPGEEWFYAYEDRFWIGQIRLDKLLHAPHVPPYHWILNALHPFQSGRAMTPREAAEALERSFELMLPLCQGFNMTWRDERAFAEHIGHVPPSTRWRMENL